MLNLPVISSGLEFLSVNDNLTYKKPESKVF